jgi:hypothetical protein
MTGSWPSSAKYMVAELPEGSGWIGNEVRPWDLSQDGSNIPCPVSDRKCYIRAQSSRIHGLQLSFQHLCIDYPRYEDETWWFVNTEGYAAGQVG